MPTGVRADGHPLSFSGRGPGGRPGLGPLLALKDAGPSYATLRSLGYANDTEAVALPAGSLQAMVFTTKQWLQVTGQDVRVAETGRPGGPAPGCSDCTGGDFPLAWCRLRHWRFQGDGAGVVPAPRSGPGRSSPPPTPLHLQPLGAGHQHTGHPAGAPWSGCPLRDGLRLARTGDQGRASLVGSYGLSWPKEIIFSVLCKGQASPR